MRERMPKQNDASVRRQTRRGNLQTRIGAGILGAGILGAGILSIGLLVQSAVAQESAPGAGPTAEDIGRRIDAGEFSRAWELAQELSGPERDGALLQLAAAQAGASALPGAIRSAGAIQDLDQRAAAYDGLAQTGPGIGMSGGQGGISAADFTDLIQLIQETIEPPSWDEENASIRPYVAGVYVDARGLLHRVRTDDQFDWRGAESASTETGSALKAPAHNGLRRISLSRLASQLREADLLGQRDPAARHLGGIYRVEYLAIDPPTGEIVLAGQAGPVARNVSGQWVNATNGQPVLLVDDLVECLRNALAGSGAFGCSIDPRAENLAATSKFLGETRLTNKPFREGLQRALGLQDVNIFGIDSGSHAAQILVEADYRMKCIGLGVEPSIREVPSYWDRIELDENELPPALGMARWWFTVNYDAVVTNQDKTKFALRGPGVKVLSEDEMLGRDGARIHTGTSTGPTKAFAEDFTRHFAAMAQAKPVFAELRNVFDLALVSALIVQSLPAEKLESSLGYFAPPTSERPDRRFYQTAKLAVPVAVESVMNHRYFETRKSGRRQRHMVVAVGGGVQFESAAVLKQQSLDTAGELDAALAKPVSPSNAWYWD